MQKNFTGNAPLAIPAAKETLKEIHEALKKIALDKAHKIMNELGLKSLSSFYDIIENRRNLSPSEKKAIAEIYNRSLESIHWNDESKPIA